MPFPQPFLDALVERNPIEEVVGQYVTLTRKGSNLFGLCPFHSEKTGSFSVAPEKGIYYCFGCHKGGGVINFIMEIESLSYPDAVRFLAKRQERVATISDRQAQIALNRMQILASHGQRVGQRHRVVNIHRGCNVAHRLALEHAFEQVLD